jgi:Transposase IS66 family
LVGARGQHAVLYATTSMTVLARRLQSDTSRVILYALNRWEALIRNCDDGRFEIDNLPVERALRGVAIGRRNYLLITGQPLPHGKSYCLRTLACEIALAFLAYRP